MNGTNAQRAVETGIVLTAREPATVVSAKNAQEQGVAQTAMGPAVNQRNQQAPVVVPKPIEIFSNGNLAYALIGRKYEVMQIRLNSREPSANDS